MEFYISVIANEMCPRCNNEIEDCTMFGNDKKEENMGDVYNRKFDEISKKKEYKNLIEHLWSFCYDKDKYRKRIWVKRCDDVAEIEKDRGLDCKDKRKRKKE
ncbi:hypothetical protein RhiirA1_479712 [Rhizophagus irregularis]|uniref:Uncharacterized protein n=1 Tax=Rhizophagus irregularis TaxID=588596 RepID=A0A2I1FLJ9_9GLOM|nr:hypothetical protein RhiirA1_479712 [Rhizophagus irregularis]PKY35239.1 hypothetical protein RhiirB3_455784 [Rhizophagus irregularis]